MDAATSRHATVRAAEIELLGSDARRDPSRAAELMHPDFLEIGRSGRVWVFDEMVEALAAEDARPTPVTDEWRFRDLAPGVVLVTYRIRRAGRDSRHSSIWDLADGSPRVVFHQGTHLPDGSADQDRPRG